MGTTGYRIIRPLLKQAKFLNLEFHGIDLIDLKADGIDETLLAQRDLRIGLEFNSKRFRRSWRTSPTGGTFDP